MLEKKIKTIAALTKILAGLKGNGKKIVFTNGCFDILHYGHVKYLEDAARYGDILVVAINSDNSIKRIKGNKKPIVNEYDRARTVAALESVDYVLLFDQDTPIKVIKALKPDVLIKGSDWDKKNIVGSGFLRSYGAKTLTVKLLKGRSTTNLIKEIAAKF